MKAAAAAATATYHLQLNVPFDLAAALSPVKREAIVGVLSIFYHIILSRPASVSGAIFAVPSVPAATIVATPALSRHCVAL